MRRVFVFCVVLIAAGTANSENLTDVDEMICAPGQAMVCLETGDCYTTTPWEVALPDFVVIDLDKKLISTTKSSSEERTTNVSIVESDDGMIFLQGVERGRAFSVVIEEVTGRMTVSVSRDGLTVAAFGACTSTDI
jgi:hypothetical protein